MTQARVELIGNKLVLVDPDALAAADAVAKHNCRNTLESQRDRVEHFKSRMVLLGRDPSEVVIVLLNVNDRAAAALAEILMPGHDWNAYRERGEIPFARGLAERKGLEDSVKWLDPECGKRMLTMRLVAVVMDHGTVEVFECAG